MNTLDILKATREKLKAPASWAQGRYARDANGEEVLAHWPQATCFCLAGAILSAEGKGDLILFPTKAAVALGFSTIGALIQWNDHPDRTHEEVLARLDQAIAKLEATNNENGCGNG